MIRVWGAGLVLLLALSVPVAGKDAGNLALASGARIGVVNLLDPEVTHFHAAKEIQASFLRTYTVNWSVAAMLSEALKEPIGQLGLVLVALGIPDSLDRSREGCFLRGSFGRGLPKECGAPFAELAAAEHVDAIIVLGPGLNNNAHAGSARRRDLPDYLRGWGFVTNNEAAATRPRPPELFNMTEMLLIGVSANGPSLRGREWGGSYSLEWTAFAPPADPKAVPPEQLDELRPLFAGILARQAKRLLEQLDVAK